MRGFNRAESLVRTFQAQRATRVRTGGGWGYTWNSLGEVVGILSNASAQQVDVAESQGQSVSHQVVQRGRPPAGIKKGDRLVIDLGTPTAKYLYLQLTPEDPGAVGLFTIYALLEGEANAS